MFLLQACLFVHWKQFFEFVHKNFWSIVHAQRVIYKRTYNKVSKIGRAQKLALFGAQKILVCWLTCITLKMLCVKKTIKHVKLVIEWLPNKIR